MAHTVPNCARSSTNPPRPRTDAQVRAMGGKAPRTPAFCKSSNRCTRGRPAVSIPGFPHPLPHAASGRCGTGGTFAWPHHSPLHPQVDPCHRAPGGRGRLHSHSPGSKLSTAPMPRILRGGSPGPPVIPHQHRPGRHPLTRDHQMLSWCRATITRHATGTTSSDSTQRHIWDNFTSDTRVQAFFTGTKKEYFLKKCFVYSYYFFLPFHFLKKKLLLKAITCNKVISQCTLFFPCDLSSEGGKLSPRPPCAARDRVSQQGSSPRLRPLPGAQPGVPAAAPGLPWGPCAPRVSGSSAPRSGGRAGRPSRDALGIAWCRAERPSREGTLPTDSRVKGPARTQALVGRSLPPGSRCRAGSPLRSHLYSDSGEFFH